MEWLNYHHLRYFWTVVREGGVTRAAAKLRLAQPTVSGQLRALESALGEKLLARSGRKLVLTEVGQTVYRYADQIFALGTELTDTLQGRATGRPVRFTVGVANVLPKLVVYRLLEPALQAVPGLQLVCREDRMERLLAALSVHELDLVLSDRPLGPQVSVRAFNHLLGECGVTFFAPAPLAKRLRRGFPASLEGAPMLVPGEDTVMRRSLEDWLLARGVRVQVRGEFDDLALLNAFGEAGMGVFTSPRIIEEAVRRQLRVEVVGRTEDMRERFYAISIERRIKHPAVSAIAEAARRSLF